MMVAAGKSAPAPDSPWIHEPGATLADLAAGARYRFELQAGPKPRRFFQIVAELPTGPLTVSFSQQQVALVEGSDGLLQQINLSQPFTGMLLYSISGTVGPANGINLSGETAVNGNIALIPLALGDDASVDALRYLQLTLSTDDAYLLGANRSVFVLIEENDSRWSGALDGDFGTLPLIVELTSPSGSLSAVIKSGERSILPCGCIRGIGQPEAWRCLHAA